MSTQIDSLSIDIEANASKATKELEALGGALADLKESGKLTTTINNLKKLSEALQSITAASKGVKCLKDLQKGLEGLNKMGELANVRTATSNLNSLNKAISKFSGSENITGVGDKLKALSSSLSGLDKSQKSISTLNSLESALEGLSDIEDLNSIEGSIKTIGKLGEALATIKQNGAIGTAVNNIGKIPEALKGMESVESNVNTITTLSKAIESIGSVNNVAKGIKELSDAFGELKETAKLTTVHNNLEKLKERLAGLREVQDVIGTIGKFRDGLVEIASLPGIGSAKDIKKDLQELSEAMAQANSKASLTKMTNALKNLNEGLGGLTNAIDGAVTIRGVGEALNSIGTVNTEAIIEIAASLRKIVSAFKPLAELDVSVLSHKVKTLVNTFSGFQNIGDMTGLQMLAKNLRSLITTAGKLNDVDFSAFAVKMRELGTAIQPLKDIEKSAGLTSIINNLRKIPKLSEDLNKVDFGSFKNKMGELAKSLEPLQGVEKATGFTSLIRALKDIPKITEQLSSENIKKFAERLKELVKELEPVYKRMSKMSNVIGQFNLAIMNGKSGMTSFVSSTNDSNVILNATIELFMKLAQAVKKLANNLSESINIAINMDGIIQRIGNSFGEQASKVNDEMERMANTFKLNKQEIMQYTGIFGSLLAGFGVATDKAKEMSLGLTQAAYDLWASNNDLYPQYESVARALKSAITGELEPIRNLGISISKAMLQATAARHGISQSIDSMTEAQKSILRYQTIVEAMQKKGVIGEYAREMNTAEGAVRMLKQQLRVLAQEFGSVFIPLLLKVIPVITAFVRVIGEGVSALAKLLGIDYNKIDWSKFKSNVDGLGDSLQESKDTATDLKRTLLGFDEINKLQDDTKAGVNLDAYDLPLDVKSLWDDSVYNQVNSKVDDLTKGLAKRFKTFADNLKPLLQPAKDAFNELWNGGLKKAGNFAWGTLKDFYNEFLKPVGEWVLGSGLPRFLEITNDLLNEIDWDKLKGALKDFYKALANLTKLTFGVLLDFYEYFLKPVAVWTMNEALPRFLKITTKLINSVDWAKLKASLTQLWKALAKLTQMTFTTLLDFYEKFLAPIAKWTLGEGIPRLAQATAKLINDIDWKKLLESLSNLYSKLKDFTIEMVFTPIIEFYENFLVPLGTWTMSEALPKLVDTLSDLFSGDWVDNLPGALKGLKDFFEIKFDKTSVWGKLAEALKEFWKGLEPMLEGLGTGALARLCAGLESFAFVGKLLLQYLVAPTLKAIGKVLQAIPPTVFEVLAVAITSFVLSIKGFTIVGAFMKLFSMSNAMGIANAITGFFKPILRVIYANPLAAAIALAMAAIYLIVKNWDSIKYVLKAIVDAVGEFFTSIGKFFVGIWEYFKEGFSLLGDFFLWLGKSIFEGIAKGLGLDPEVLKKAIKSIVDTICNFFCDLLGIHSPSTVFAGFAGSIIDGLVEGINAGIEVVKQVIGTVVDAITTTWEAIKTVASTVWNGIKTVVTTVWNTIKDVALTVWYGIKNAIVGTWKTIKYRAIQIWTSIKEAVLEFWDTVKEKASEIWNGIKDTVLGVWDKIKEKATEVWNGVKDTVVGAWETIKEKVSEIWENIKKGLEKLWDIITAPFKNAFNNVSEIIHSFANGGIVEGTKKIIEKIKSGLSNLVSIATAPFRLMVNKAIEIIDKVIPGFKEKATAIIDGIKNGIKSGIEKVKNAIKDIVDAIKKKFCDLLGIHSPSTIFQGYAGNIIDGLIKGLKAGIGKITSVVNDYLVKPVSNGVGKAMDSVLSNDTQIKIGDRLRMLAGESEADIRGFQLKKKGVPKYASGGYPEKGQMFIANEAGAEMVGTLDGKTAVANQNSITDALIAALYPAIRDAFADANQGQSTEVNVTLEGDANKMFKVIQQKGKSYQLSTGRSVF